MPQLDGLRGIAITCIFLAHFYTSSFLNHYLHLGRVGVIMFFVLSGFLITRILLGYQDRSLNDRALKWKHLLLFYGRRALRIFPIYYLTLLVAFLIGSPGVQERWTWLATYTYNYCGYWYPMGIGLYREISHLWSLHIEEQVYVLWPFLILFMRRPYLPYLFYLLILVAILFKAMAAQMDFVRNPTIWTLGCIDSIAIGALYAYYWHEGNTATALHRNIRWLAMIGLPLYVGLQALRLSSETAWRQTALYTPLLDVSISLVFLPVLSRAAEGSQNVVGRFLSWGPLRYLGKISYGLYLYHMFLVTGLRAEGLRVPHGLTYFLFYSTLTILVASISWFLIERPLLKLKHHLVIRRDGPR